MGEHKHKPMISVILPSRGRPLQCRRAVESLNRNAGNCRIEILVGLDEDDPTLEEYRLVDAEICIAPRGKTLGAIQNRLAAQARGRYLMFFTDDYVLEQPEWGQAILTVGKRLPQDIGVLYLDDPTHPGFSTFPVIPRAVYETVGYLAPAFFPYWFTDTWYDEIGELLAAKLQVPVTVAAPEGRGKTHGLIDLPFWLDVFERTRPLRVNDTLALAAKGFGEEAARRGADSTEFMRRLTLCEKRVAHLHDPALQAKLAEGAASKPGPFYEEVKAEAAALCEKLEKLAPKRLRVAICIPSADTWKAGTATDIAGISAYSASAGIEVAILGFECATVTNARNGIVEMALANKCSHLLWVDSDMRAPPDTIVRLLNHNKDIVGAVYNKRPPPHTTLGRLKGDKPEDMSTISPLHEATLLPGGMMLVKADVYRKIGWPAYFEVYNWSAKAADGFEGFKLMMRNLFSQAPSDEVLASLDGTAFADWMKDHFVIGEDDEPVLMFSEDYAFCRKARRAGFEIWADLELSTKIAHLGTMPVTAALPKETKFKEAAE
jgi:glycosyltransferase involved in cell wall biosynthesis